MAGERASSFISGVSSSRKQRVVRTECVCRRHPNVVLLIAVVETPPALIYELHACDLRAYVQQVNLLLTFFDFVTDQQL